ncbi:hypothetical protein [Desulfuromonas sp. AOP6]|uniref:hypothetical protein n=1 Tax=Desulfuromonas sp. AOP6 TaxID=1566351 RepID=UPI001287EC53|nr:hypothetical protein [Desulfuromonas sp. AOP6]BCA80654.1 hypothetical protein AOP6_2441 [Desulfuromonas sp. AOP6]
MVVGFNHNFRYKNEVYHIQTEDGGLKNPHIVTLLYRGGTILASKKTSYADILGTSHLETVVEGRMKTQHREMIRRLKDGELDAVLFGAKAEASPGSQSKAEPMPPAAAPGLKEPQKTAPISAEEKTPASSAPSQSAPSSAVPAESLDDLIFSYLVGDDKKTR